MEVGFALLGLGVVSLTIHWTLSAHHCDGVLWSSPEQSTAPTGLILGSSGCLCCKALHTTTFTSLRKHSLRHSLPPQQPLACCFWFAAFDPLGWASLPPTVRHSPPPTPFTGLHKSPQWLNIPTRTRSRSRRPRRSQARRPTTAPTALRLLRVTRTGSGQSIQRGSRRWKMRLCAHQLRSERSSLTAPAACVGGGKWPAVPSLLAFSPV